MTLDQIIRMAREAGLLADDEAWVSPYQEAMERFAALVREQAYREDKSLTLGFEVTERKCVDLTDDEIHAAIDEPTEDLEVMMWRTNYCRAVIAAFKEKNK